MILDESTLESRLKALRTYFKRDLTESSVDREDIIPLMFSFSLSKFAEMMNSYFIGGNRMMSLSKDACSIESYVVLVKQVKREVEIYRDNASPWITELHGTTSVNGRVKRCA